MNKVIHAESSQAMKSLDANSVDSIVTDPPYGLSFMGKKWDYDVPSVELWKECLRVLKPGGHLLSFSGSRTYHRMAVNIEDAGFEIRDQIMWLYGSGFPKSLNIGKAIDKMAGVERETAGEKKRFNGSSQGKVKKMNGGSYSNNENQKGYISMETIPATDEAKQWDGWGTALKPAHEPIVVARKPLEEKNVALNVLKYGTGGINIDDCRVGTEEIKTQGGDKFPKNYGIFNTCEESIHQGRFPANIILDEEAGQLLDEQSGVLKSGDLNKNIIKAHDGFEGKSFKMQEKTSMERKGDIGGASRFFYCAKASKSERGIDNKHPTVKPLKLMTYLIRLVTPKEGIVLDPFAGSGTTLVAAKKEGFNFVGIEMEQEYIEIIQARLNEVDKQTLTTLNNWAGNK